MLQRGLIDSSVADWQHFLNRVGMRDLQGRVLAEDGDFGENTENATKRFQTSKGVPATGVVDTATIALASGFDLTATPADGLQFIQAKNFTPCAVRNLDVLTVHVMQAPEKGNTARSTSQFFANQPRHKTIDLHWRPDGKPWSGSSAHICVDATEAIRCVQDNDIAWHAPGVNDTGIGIEHAGFSEQTPAQWADDYSVKMLDRSAWIMAVYCAFRALPIVFLNEGDLIARKKGITGHVQVTRAFKVGDHWDPGPSFPWQSYLEKIQEFAVKLPADLAGVTLVLPPQYVRA